MTTTNEPAATVEVDGLRVHIHTGRHEDGTAFLSLHPENCNLDGEMPGEYDLRPLSAERPGAWSTLGG